MSSTLWAGGLAGVVALAALRLAVEHFGDVPENCTQFLKEQEWISDFFPVQGGQKVF